MINEINISMAMKIAEVAKAIYVTIEKSDVVGDKEALFDLCFVQVINSINANIVKNNNVDNFFGYALRITENQIKRWYHNSVKE